MTRYRLFFLILAATLSLSAQERRSALVIGNGAYRQSALKTPVNDATDMSQALKAAGFDIVLRTDATADAMKGAIREWVARLKETKGIAFFFYSGYAFSYKAKNYLLPIGMESRGEAEAAAGSLDLEELCAELERSGLSLGILVFDASRPSPFPSSGYANIRGLVGIKPKLPEYLVLHSAEAGQLSAEGVGRNSPFSQILLKNMASPGQDILSIIKRVKTELSQATGGIQSPGLEHNLRRDFILFPGSMAEYLKPAIQGSNPGFGPSQASLGHLSVSLQSPGVVRVLSRQLYLSAGSSLPISGLSAGILSIDVEYEDGVIETKQALVEAGKTTSVGFSYKPGPLPPPRP